MRVRMKATLSGTRDGQPWPERGGIVDLPDDEAQHLIRAGIAEEHGEDPDEADEPEDEPEKTPEPVEETEPEPVEETATPADAAEKAVPAGRRRSQTK
ncbi:hypothetical protein [Streptomyces sp. NPDC002535]